MKLFVSALLVMLSWQPKVWAQGKPATGADQVGAMDVVPTNAGGVALPAHAPHPHAAFVC